MTARRPHSTARAGFSLLEVMVSTTILLMVFGGVLTVSTRSRDAFQRSVANAEVLSLSRGALDRIAGELVAARVDNLVPAVTTALGSSSIEFDVAQDWVAGAAQWGRVRISWVRSPAELDNGIDDDGNGLIDEGDVVRVSDPGGPDEQSVVLVRGVSELFPGEQSNLADDNDNGLVDEAGLCFTVDGRTVGLRLSVERLGPDGRLLARSFETRVVLRNGDLP